MGDVNRARQLIDKQVLDDMLREPAIEPSRGGLRKHLDTLDNVRRTYNDIDSTFKVERKGLDFRLALSREFRKRLLDQADIEMKDLVVASLYNYLGKLSEKLDRLRQKYEIIDKQSYRYALPDYSPRYEMKGLLRGRSLDLDRHRLSERLREMGYEVSVDGKTRFMFLRAYSQSSYIELSVFIPRVSVVISLLSPSRDKALELGEAAISSLAEHV